MASGNAREIWSPVSQRFWSLFIVLGSNLFSFAHRSGKLARNELPAPPMLIYLAFVFGHGQSDPKNSAA